MRNYYLILALLLALSTGCKNTNMFATTTKDSRKAATETRKLVAEYRANQQKRLDEINHTYQQDFGKVMSEMTKLLYQEVYQDFDHEAVAISEKYIRDWPKETQPGRVGDDFLQTIQGDFQKLRKAETNLNQIRLSYAQQYQDVSAQLKLLEQIEGNLEAVSKTPSQWRDIQEALRIFYQAYQKTQAATNLATTNTVAQASAKP